MCDNYATHKHPDVTAWLDKNPRITLHFTSMSGSWLNMAKIYFEEPYFAALWVLGTVRPGEQSQPAGHAQYGKVRESKCHQH